MNERGGQKCRTAAGDDDRKRFCAEEHEGSR
jgi:hypothetical protein